MTLKPGTRITIHGRPATVVDYNYSTGKFEVRIDGLTINTFHTKIDPPTEQNNERPYPMDDPKRYAGGSKD